MEWRFWAQTRLAQLNRLGDASGDDCEAIEPLLSLYGDGMASAAEARRVEAHLPGCESCRESLAWMQATRRALSARPVQSPPPNLHARIAEAISASETAPLRLRPARTFVTRPAFAAAASLTVVGLFLGYSLTHLPRPSVSIKPVPTVATVPDIAPPVLVSPVKPTAPSVAVKKPKPAPLMANNAGPDDTQTATTETAPPPRVTERLSVPTMRVVPKAAPALPAPRPQVKPVAPPKASLIATQPPATIKKTLPALPTKESPQIARNYPDVQVLPATVTPQEPPAPEQTAPATPSEPRLQTVDFIREVRAHLPSPRKFGQSTVGLSVRGASAVTRTFGNEGSAQPLFPITHGPLGSE